jgi:hypothetical protein
MSYSDIGFLPLQIDCAVNIVVFIPPLVGFRLVPLAIAPETSTFPYGNVVLNSPNEFSGATTATAPCLRMGFMARLTFFQAGYFPDVERSSALTGAIMVPLHGGVVDICG